MQFLKQMSFKAPSGGFRGPLIWAQVSLKLQEQKDIAGETILFFNIFFIKILTHFGKMSIKK